MVTLEAGMSGLFIGLESSSSPVSPTLWERYRGGYVGALISTGIVRGAPDAARDVSLLLSGGLYGRGYVFRGFPSGVRAIGVSIPGLWGATTRRSGRSSGSPPPGWGTINGDSRTASEPTFEPSVSASLAYQPVAKVRRTLDARCKSEAYTRRIEPSALHLTTWPWASDRRRGGRRRCG